MAIAYGAVSWLLLQASSLIFDAFDIPHTALRAVFVVLALGFLPALVFSWIYELTPEGLRREADPDANSGPNRVVGRRLDLMIFSVLCALIVLLLVDRFVFAPRTPASPAASHESADRDQSKLVSIAVLPFADMSATHDQEYFSDGVSEEVLTLLSQVAGLQVAGRTSSFSFRDKKATIAEVGRALNVGTVLEGSVRKSGDRLRVTAQLISVADGYNLWSKSYDRKLVDVFAVQDDIAGAVVDALKVRLLPADRPSTARHHVPAFETYDRYLLGRQMLARSSNGDGNSARARDAFAAAIEKDSSYAAAYSGLAMAESFVSEDLRDASEIRDTQARAMSAADRAVMLDPELGDAYAARGYLRGANAWDWDGAMADLTRAVALDPADGRNQMRYGFLLAAVGRLSDARTAVERGIEHEPLLAPLWYCLGRIKAGQTDYEGASLALHRALAIDPDFRAATSYLGVLSLIAGNAGEALAYFRQAGNAFGAAIAEWALGDSAQSAQAMDDLIAKHAADGAYGIAQAYAWRGSSDDAFAWLHKAVEQHDGGLIALKYDPLLASLRADARYDATVASMGLPK
ncbi:MAG: tetratricopeptide repeat protein [Rhodanobacteraceae bacterium]